MGCEVYLRKKVILMKFVEAGVVKILGPTALLLIALATSMNVWADNNKKRVDTSRTSERTSNQTVIKCDKKTLRDSTCTGSGLRNVTYCYPQGRKMTTVLGSCVSRQ